MDRKFLPWLAGLFVLLSVADLSLTLWLLETRGGHVYEANPIANWFLQSSGTSGLLLLKGGSVLFAVTALCLLARFRPALAQRVLGAGCLAVLTVVLLGGILGMMTNPSTQPDVVMNPPPRLRTREVLRPWAEPAPAPQPLSVSAEAPPLPTPLPLTAEVPQTPDPMPKTGSPPAAG